MNWQSAKNMLRSGAKITRPNWEKNHFWVLSKDGFERILCYDGTNARVHLEQTEANDWKIFEEEKTLSDEIYKQAPGSERLKDSIPVDKAKKSIKKLKETIKDDCGILVGYNNDSSCFVDWQKINQIIKEIFGEKLCSK